MDLIEQDIQALERKTSKGFRMFFLVLMPLVVIFLLLMSGYDLLLCHKWASLLGFTISDVFYIWLKGISPTKSYSGIVLIAIQRVQIALFQIEFAIFVGILVWIQRKTIDRNSRMLKFIKKEYPVRD